MPLSVQLAPGRHPLTHTPARPVPLQVKSLIEGGTFLHRPLLDGVLQHLHSLVNECAMRRPNPHLLPLLAFVHKCVGVGPEEFWEEVERLGLRHVLLGDEEGQGQQGGAAGDSAGSGADAAGGVKEEEEGAGSGELQEGVEAAEGVPADGGADGGEGGAAGQDTGGAAMEHQSE
jgi:hypothetical protein